MSTYCCDKISSFDTFAPHIQLELRNQRGFKTVIGGLCTLFFGILAIALLIIDITSVFINPELEKSEECLFVDYNFHGDPIRLDPDSDKIMMKFNSQFPKELQDYTSEQFLRIQYYFMQDT